MIFAVANKLSLWRGKGKQKSLELFPGVKRDIGLEYNIPINNKLFAMMPSE